MSETQKYCRSQWQAGFFWRFIKDIFCIHLLFLCFVDDKDTRELIKTLTRKQNNLNEIKVIVFFGRVNPTVVSRQLRSMISLSNEREYYKEEKSSDSYLQYFTALKFEKNRVSFSFSNVSFFLFCECVKPDRFLVKKYFYTYYQWVTWNLKKRINERL